MSESYSTSMCAFKPWKCCKNLASAESGSTVAALSSKKVAQRGKSTRARCDGRQRCLPGPGRGHKSRPSLPSARLLSLRGARPWRRRERCACASRLPAYASATAAPLAGASFRCLCSSHCDNEVLRRERADQLDRLGRPQAWCRRICVEKERCAGASEAGRRRKGRCNRLCLASCNRCWGISSCSNNLASRCSLSLSQAL